MNQNPRRSVGDLADCARCGGLMMISDQLVSVCGQCLRRGNHQSHQRRRRSTAPRKRTHRSPSKRGNR